MPTDLSTRWALSLFSLIICSPAATAVGIGHGSFHCLAPARFFSARQPRQKRRADLTAGRKKLPTVIKADPKSRLTFSVVSLCFLRNVSATFYRSHSLTRDLANRSRNSRFRQFPSDAHKSGITPAPEGVPAPARPGPRGTRIPGRRRRRRRRRPRSLIKAGTFPIR